MNIESFTQSNNQGDFVKAFTAFHYEVGRPSISAAYENLVIHLFPDKKKEFFIARDEAGQIVGKIGVSLMAGSSEAVFGFFELNEAHSLSLQTFMELEKLAVSWARENGVDQIFGPVNYNTWFTNRFKTNSGGDNLSWEPHNPPSYPEFFEQQGWEKDREYVSKFYSDNKLILERTKKSYLKAVEEGYHFREIDIEREGEGDLLYRLNCDSFQDNYLFEPITREQYDKAFLQVIKGMNLDLCTIILDKMNIEQGYIYSYIDEQGYQIIKSILVLPSTRGAGLSSALLHKSILEAKNSGFTKICGALVRRGNVSENFFDTLGTPEREHIYSLYKKKII